MKYTTLSDFVNNAEYIVSNIIINEGFTTIKTKRGNVVLMSERQYNYLIESLSKKNKIVYE